MPLTWPTGLPVFPAHAGMARSGPHHLEMRIPFSPHTRGWPAKRSIGGETEAVFPAHAGMAQRSSTRTFSRLSFSPHTRGWPDLPGRLPILWRGFPRTRGDGPTLEQQLERGTFVFPAQRGEGPLFISALAVGVSGLKPQKSPSSRQGHIPHHLRGFSPLHPAQIPKRPPMPPGGLPCGLLIGLPRLELSL